MDNKVIFEGSNSTRKRKKKKERNETAENTYFEVVSLYDEQILQERKEKIGDSLNLFPYILARK